LRWTFAAPGGIVAALAVGATSRALAPGNVMAQPYSSDLCRQLARLAREADLLRPPRFTRHEAGDLLELDVTGVAPAWRARAALRLEKYVGGGFAGQVYRARLERLEPELEGADAVSLRAGETYAVKIFVPWSRFGKGLRDTLYGVGFQAPFGLQSNPSAVRAAALWHKFIRRGAAERLGSEQAVVDVHATFFEPTLGSMGEVLEWIDGRVWRLEVDDTLFSREVPRGSGAGDTEFAAKRRFMQGMVGLFHEMGAPEFARQYEWWTMKSQPNVLKRRAGGDDAAAGLVAVDFGAGLALLPFLPMSPADVKLIVKGMARGRLVQFDRGDLDALGAYVAARPERFADLAPALEELRQAEEDYHGAQPDLLNHRTRVLTDGGILRRSTRAWARSFALRGRMDEPTAERYATRPLRLALFILVGLVPLLGRFVQQLWGSAAYRAHVGRAITSAAYLKRALAGRQAEALIDWHRRGRATEARTRALVAHPMLFWLQAWTLALLPAGVHRFLTDGRYALGVLWYVFVRPLALLFHRASRERWLMEMIEEGEREGILTPAEAEEVRARAREPYIQTYLMSMVVHLFTIPITQVVSVALGAYLAAKYGEGTAESGAIFAGTVALFQVLPLSPGSVSRGLYATGVALAKWDWKNYSWAVVISYWKYIGYLGFPIQMARTYPTLSRFVASRWAIHATGSVPVFGERGALLEYGVFNLFFNWPVSLRRRWLEEGADRARVRGPLGWLGTFLGCGHVSILRANLASAVTAAAAAGAWVLGAPAWAVGAAAAVVFAAGVPAAAAFERRLGRKDPGCFVLDEVLGMLVAALALWLPWHVWWYVTIPAAYLAFRLADVYKPPPVGLAERLPGGWGVMADDLVAAAWALVATIGVQMLAAAIDARGV
jgi:phosphatidylglycerophosphatase A